MNYTIPATICLLITFVWACSSSEPIAQKTPQKDVIVLPGVPQIAFTFDDGSTQNMPLYPLKKWNEKLLNTLEKHNTKAFFFPAGKFLKGKKGQFILQSWNDAGHFIGNHTFNHPNFNSEKVSLDQFKYELMKNDSFVNRFGNFRPYFRFPYLKEGNTVEKRDGFRAFLKEKNYHLGHVTIDASDWYINQRLVKRLRQEPRANTDAYRDFYVEHLFERACFYDTLAYHVTQKRIKHNILLHHNFTSALFLDDLIKHFKENGWQIIDADEAYKDPIYQSLPKTLPAGESLIWGMAKETQKLDSLLRYPAEDSRYEKERMDELGL